MSTSNNISLPVEKCMKFRQQSDILMSSCTQSGGIDGFCNHKCCQSCFKKENMESALTSSTNYKFTCPCCHASFYKSMQSIDEATTLDGILIGEATTLIKYVSPRMTERTLGAAEAVRTNNLNMLALEKLESVLLLNPTSFYALYFIFRVCYTGRKFLLVHKDVCPQTDLYKLKVHEYAFRLLDHPSISDGNEFVQCVCCDELSNIFHEHYNYPAALKYAKLAYEHCLRSPDRKDLSSYKHSYLESRAHFADLPPLRFAVGDEVEFLHELETGSEWKRGKVVELYYRERDFDVTFNAPYRIQLLDDSDSAAQPPVYAWVKADTDRYVRKVGVKAIEGTRYQARLDTKVEDLVHVYCSEEFLEDIYGTLAQDREFVDMLRSKWRIKLSESTIIMYRALVMHREPLLRIESGYQVPLSEEVIAGIKAYFDPAYRNATPSAEEDSNSSRVKAEVIGMLQGTSGTIDLSDETNYQGYLRNSITSTLSLGLPRLSPLGSLSYDGRPGRRGQSSVFTVPSWMSEAISRATSTHDIRHLSLEVQGSIKLEFFLCAWSCVHTCLERGGAACECPFVYFFIKACVEQGLGVPKLALDLYDRMNMQLSREFIRCANPACELNRLDQSTGQVKFKKCSRCQAVIYCSRECQVAHYPEHKRLCREHSSD